MRLPYQNSIRISSVFPHQFTVTKDTSIPSRTGNHLNSIREPYKRARSGRRKYHSVGGCMGPQIWLRVAPERDFFFRFCVTHNFMYALTAPSAQDCAQVGHILYFCFAPRNVISRPWQWYFVEVPSTSDMQYCVAVSEAQPR